MGYQYDVWFWRTIRSTSGETDRQQPLDVTTKSARVSPNETRGLGINTIYILAFWMIFLQLL